MITTRNISHNSGEDEESSREVTKEVLSTEVIVGKILKPHGLKGENRILPFTADINNFRSYKSFIIENKCYPVLYFKWAGKYLVVKLVGVESVNAAKALQGQFLRVERSDIFRLGQAVRVDASDGTQAVDPASVLIADLINLAVYAEIPTSIEAVNLSERSHEVLNDLSVCKVGIIDGYYDIGENGMLRIALAKEMLTLVASAERHSKSFFMPCDDEYLGKIELFKKRIWIKNLERLLELK